MVEALLVVMARQGYEAASIGQIARQAGLTAGLVHYHFRSKQEILLALLDELARRHFEGLAAVLAGAGESAAAQLSAFIDRHLAVGASADPDELACWVLLGAEAIRQPQVCQAQQQVVQRLAALLREIIERGIEQRLFSCDSSAAAAGALLAVIQGYYMIASTARMQIPRGSAAPSARKMAEGLLSASLPRRARRSRGSRR